MSPSTKWIIAYASDEKQVIKALSDPDFSQTDIWADIKIYGGFGDDRFIKSPFIHVWNIRRRDQPKVYGRLRITEMEIGGVLVFEALDKEDWAEVNKYLDTVYLRMELDGIRPCKVLTETSNIPLFLLDISWREIPFEQFQNLINSHTKSKSKDIKSTINIMKKLSIPKDLILKVIRNTSPGSSSTSQNNILPSPDDTMRKYGTRKNLTLSQVRHWVAKFRKARELGYSYPQYYQSLVSSQLWNVEYPPNFGNEESETNLILQPYPPFAYETMRGWLKSGKFD